MSARTFAVFTGVLAVIGLLAYGVISKGHGTLAAGDVVPTTSLQTLDGASAGSLADYQGKWVLINVWASWCGPCKDEAPALESFYRDHRGDNFEILGIDTQETAEGGQGFVDEFELSYPQLHDGDGGYADDLKTTGVPENFLVAPDGTLAVAQHGQVDETFLRQQVLPRIEGELAVVRRVAVLLALVAALAFANAAGAQQPQPQTSLPDIEDEVMCPVCGVTLELATESPQANQERDFIRQLIAQGLTKDEIKDRLVAEFGSEVLAEPGDSGFDLAAWLVPGMAIVLAGGAIFIGVRRWRRAGRAEQAAHTDDPEPDADDSERLDADLARYRL